MHGPPLIGWGLVALCAAAGIYCLSRTRAGAAGERRAAWGDALMGLGMAAMAVPTGALDARPWGTAAFAAVFGAVGLHALAPARARAEASRAHDGHQLHHAVGAFAMVYMALAMAHSPTAGHGGVHHLGAGHEPAGTPLLTGVLLVYFAVYVVRAVARIVPAPAMVPGEPPWPGPERAYGSGLTRACRLSMGIGMLAMLLTM
ncbi:hypothetical protein FHS39_002782 [Streptomyces olivoverticillatus]|uniref:DUF5134 domain-containing protein n=1 Tax=Streptomyces olivoverticillatus TaxID=66427 RepID=A0A7W7PK16_9ACTN|nr:hypothetical protein [Streptomyces olivoverticillatus]